MMPGDDPKDWSILRTVTEKRWAKVTDPVLTAAALVFLAAYSWEIICRPTSAGRIFAESVINVTWALFAVDVGVRLFLTDHKFDWITHHPLEIASVVLPILRPLRLLRLVALVTVLERTAGRSLRGRITAYTVGSAALLIWIASLTVLDAERDVPGATITSLGDALWWAFATITTVGYGDRAPVTATGRVVAVALMIAGISILGVVTATLASWMVEQVSETSEQQEVATREQVQVLTSQIAQLRTELAEQRDAASSR